MENEQKNMTGKSFGIESQEPIVHFNDRKMKMMNKTQTEFIDSRTYRKDSTYIYH